MHPYFALPFAWNPPATPEQLAHAAVILEMEWLPELLALYQQHNGASGLVDNWEQQWAKQLEEDEYFYYSLPWLMSLNEVIEFDEQRKQMYEGFRIFWDTFDTDKVGVYTEGPLRGMVLLYRSDEPSLVPRFRSTQDFLVYVTHNLQTNLFTWDSSPDYQDFSSLFPTLAPDPLHDAEDWARAQACYQLAQSSTTEHNPYLEVAVNMTPFEHSDALLPYLDHADFYVAARAAEILGGRRYAPARARLEQLAAANIPNVSAAARRAIQHWEG